MVGGQLTRVVRRLIGSSRVKHVGVPIAQASDVELMATALSLGVKLPEVRQTANVELMATFVGDKLVELWLADIKQLKDGRVRLDLTLLWPAEPEPKR